MKKILILVLFFCLGVLATLRYQHYTQGKTEEGTTQEKIKCVVDGVAEDCSMVKQTTHSVVEACSSSAQEEVATVE